MTRKEFGLVGCALVTALPALNIIGWISASAQQSRYLYMPGIWIALVMAQLVGQVPRPMWFFSAGLLANALASYTDLDIYRDMLHRTEIYARLIQEQSGHARQIVIANFPAEPNGIFFFRDELVRQVQARMGTTQILVDGSPEPAEPAVRFRWDAPSRTAVLSGSVPPRSGFFR